MEGLLGSRLHVAPWGWFALLTQWCCLSAALPLQLPIMLQQYVEHGGCLFKVYVLGDTYGESYWTLS